MSNPSNFKFAKSDEWISVEGNVGTIGVSDFAQSQLSDIVYLEFLVEPGDEFSKGDSLVTLESVKAAADVSSPVSGKVLEVNETLTDDFDAVNSDPFGKAWMVKVELSDPSELDALMTADEYTKYCEERDH
ncbi:MAG TPA: glycine cleavage system protein GcvH [Anaerolineaceae bacterium]|nr:glycine cleavage system protein GcvH [Anaerolineaceae bacterium]